MFLSNLNLSYKISGGFLSIFIILVSSVLLTITKVNDTSGITNAVIERRVPTTQATIQMLNGINQSLAALRGWIILGHDQFKVERDSAWANTIDSSLSEMKKQSAQWTNPKNIEKLATIENSLNEFRKAQEEIEAVAQSIENEPALKILLEDAAPQASILAA